MTHKADHIPIARRALTEQERQWITDILSANKQWADVSVGDLYAIGKCPCGLCRTILLEPPQQPHNPSWKRGQIGEIDIQTETGDLITVALHAKEGSLTELELICEHSFKAVPEKWTETRRWVNVES